MKVISFSLIFVLIIALISGCSNIGNVSVSEIELNSSTDINIIETPSALQNDNDKKDSKESETSGAYSNEEETSNSADTSFNQTYSMDNKSSESFVCESSVSKPQAETTETKLTVSEGDPNKKGIFARRNVLVKHFYDNIARESMAYSLVLPINYDANQSYPMLLYLHGMGVEGSDGERHINLLSIMQGKAPTYLDNAILIAPQCPTGKSWNIYEDGIGLNGTLVTVKRLLDSIAGQYSCDENRIYAVGYSFGGYGVMALTDRYTNYFAAIQVIAGWYNNEELQNFVNLPIWFHHGTADNVVSYENSVELYNAISKLGSEKVKLSSYDGIGHNSYSNAFRNMDIYGWMFSQTN